MEKGDALPRPVQETLIYPEQGKVGGTRDLVLARIVAGVMPAAIELDRERRLLLLVSDTKIEVGLKCVAAERMER